MRGVWLIPLLCLSPAACSPASGQDGGGSSGGSSSGGLVCTPTTGSAVLPWPSIGDAGVTLEGFPQAYVAAYCAAMSNCYPMSDELVSECTLALGSFDDFEFQECTAGLCGGHLVQPPVDPRAEVRAARAGRLSFDGSQATACLGSPWPLACRQGLLAPTPPPSCAAVFTAAIGDGGACYLNEECLGGLCVTGSSCPGYCQAAAAAPLSDGGGELCPCAAGLTCAQGLCWAGAAGGAACKSAFDCQPGFYCSPSHGSTCQPQVGQCEACTENLIESQDAWSGQCQPGLFCGGLFAIDGGLSPNALVPGVCVTPRAEGAPCVSVITPAELNGPVTGCLPGLDCIGGVCALPPSQGPCLVDDTPCLVGTAACFVGTGECQALSDSLCNPASCVPGLSCVNGTCVASISPPSCPEP
jgi:hypothetical protein